MIVETEMALIKTEKIEFCDAEVTVKELTVRQVADVMDEMKNYQPHVLDLIVERDIPVQVVILSTGLDEEKLMAATPSELEHLYDKVLKVNPSLAALTERLKKIVSQFQEKQSGSPAASSS